MSHRLNTYYLLTYTYCMTTCREWWLDIVSIGNCLDFSIDEHLASRPVHFQSIDLLDWKSKRLFIFFKFPIRLSRENISNFLNISTQTCCFFFIFMVFFLKKKKNINPWIAGG